ncbi:MAG: hypothetical protein E6H92_05675 [Chloroflexi bacterium]|nr:MAG: hypothetical protein E6H92_05675 [Chloroflexota bacterium]
MVLRVGSAVVLIVVVVAALAAGSPWVYAAMAVFLGVALLEFLALTRALGSTAPWWLLFPLSYALLLRDRLPLWLDLTAVLAIAAVAGLGIMVFVRDWRSSLTRWALAVGGSLYLGYLLSFYLALYFLPPQPDTNHTGFLAVIVVFVSVWAGDTAAMVVGTRWGRHRFFPKISPNKSAEGAIAGLLASSAVLIAGGPFIGAAFPHNLVLGVLVGAAAQVGDLVESQIKRGAGVKDASQVIPGHGGVLDRIDSLLLVGVLVYYYFRVFHLT